MMKATGFVFLRKGVLIAMVASQALFWPFTALANEFSTDITTQVTSTVEDQDLIDSGGLVIVFPGIPDAADLIAYHLDANGDQLFALDTAVELPGPEIAFPGDVMRYDGAVYSNVWRASSEGLPAGVMTDAISRMGDDLILSFSQTVDLGGVIADDEDVIQLTPGGPVLLLDGSAQGITRSLDLDAVSYDAEQAGLIYVSFDISGQVGGLSFDDEDVLEFRLSDGQWRRYSSAGPQYAADLDAFQVDFRIFSDGFESGD